MSQNDIKNIKIANEILIPEIIRLLEQGHTVTLKVKGYSMRPFLEHERDDVLLAAAKDIRIGDAVLAEVAPKCYVLHRLIKNNNGDVTLLGDGNLTPEHCKFTDIHGKAIGFYRKGNTQPDSCNDTKWKIYSWIWTRLFPIRRYLLWIHRKILKL